MLAETEMISIVVEREKSKSCVCFLSDNFGVHITTKAFFDCLRVFFRNLSWQGVDLGDRGRRVWIYGILIGYGCMGFRQGRDLTGWVVG